MKPKILNFVEAMQVGEILSKHKPQIGTKVEDMLDNFSIEDLSKLEALLGVAGLEVEKSFEVVFLFLRDSGLGVYQLYSEMINLGE